MKGLRYGITMGCTAFMTTIKYACGWEMSIWLWLAMNISLLILVICAVEYVRCNDD